MRRPFYCPSPEAFKELSRTSNMVPVFRDILADTDTPVSAFMKIDNGGDAFLLESVEGGEKWGRYSFLGVGPRMVVRGSGKTVEVIEGGKKRLLEGDPIDIIQDLLKGYRPASVEGEPRFSGGAIGYMGYDIVRHIERLPDISPRELSLPDIYLILTDTFLVFDNVEHRIKIVSNAYINDGDDPGEVYARSIAKIEAVVVQLRKNTPQKNENEELSRRMAAKLDDFTITSNFKRDDFLKAVERIKEYIVEGDIFQAVISQRFSAPLNADPFDIYRALRVINPSPYMFYLKLGEATLVGSSPEILVRVEGESVNVKPIAGTRKRGRNEEEDVSLEKDLLADPKELSEHIMLVDLGRNDVGRVAESGTVEVDELMAIERYSHVMHIVSNVKGVLKKGMSSFDALKACFPAGTLTGAPKVRAMEIIEELEPCKREVYGGCVGYFGFSGNMDTCIAIRTMVIANGRIHMQAGAGVVADSVPVKEFEETENKARGMLKAVEMAMEGLF